MSQHRFPVRPADSSRRDFLRLSAALATTGAASALREGRAGVRS
jgi:hypothetical protein